MKAIVSQSTAADLHITNDFLQVIQYLYRHAVFKNILDIVVTKCTIGQLSFRVQNMKLFDFDAGSCLTMVDDLGYADAKRKKYLITIKKVSSDVIMHEIGHMLEQELGHIISMKDFASTLMSEIYSIGGKQLHMKSIVESLFVEQVKSYPEAQHISELFARFFEFFAASNELAFQSSLAARYTLQSAISTFPRTLEFLDSKLSDSWKTLIDPKIAAESEKYLQTSSNSNINWADKRVKASNVGATTSSRWKVKSNKDDPFK
jgi:hypothetical protein